ncbi:MAG TPA: DUF2851 family protein, partial [Flavisolibacter sp.]|nr:DUF2851 family protein [Flavisolibacter sp.]
MSIKENKGLSKAKPSSKSGNVLSEKLLQFIWQFGYFNKAGLTTTQGEELVILYAGVHNKNQGPDFTAAKIRVGDTVLAGTAELHLKTSDWKRHNHEEDEQYKNVVLHVVFEHDCVVNSIPVLELGPRVSNLLLHKYASFMEAGSFVACGRSINSVKEITWAAW